MGTNNDVSNSYENMKNWTGEMMEEKDKQLATLEDKLISSTKEKEAFQYCLYLMLRQKYEGE